jgi:hypothetical protein
MQSRQFLALSTRILNDQKAWSQEATRLTLVPPIDLAEIERAAAIIDRVTTNAIATCAKPPIDRAPRTGGGRDARKAAPADRCALGQRRTGAAVTSLAMSATAFDTCIS